MQRQFRLPHRHAIALCLLVCSAGVAVAVEPDSAHLEGNDQVRERLDGLQGQPLPELALTDWIGGGPLGKADLAGKIVVLDFWATWCGPCIASIPHNNKLAQRWPERVVVIGVCHPQGAEQMQEVVDEHGIAYPVAVDGDEALGKALGVNGYPDYYIVAPDGTIWAADVANNRVAKAVEDLLAATK